MHEKIAIFGYPRSGTKLLANVLEQQGYFNLGEFFESYSTHIETDPIRAVRTNREDQIKTSLSLDTNTLETLHIQSLKVTERKSLFKLCDIPYTTLTVFIHCIELYPELLDILKDRYFLCIRRKNELETLISRSITYNYKNYDNEIKSERIKINISIFERWFFQLKKLNRIQDYLVSVEKGQIIDFNELILGNAKLGFDYIVTSEDQHDDLSEFVINYEDVINKYKYLSDRFD
jgi:hypothetical protein